MCASVRAAEEPVTFDLRIPKDAPNMGEEDAYLCTTLPLPAQPMKLVGVKPLAKQEVVHHILLFGCSVPHMVPRGGKQPVWDCKRAPTCGTFEETILYGWGRNAAKLTLPEGVGFSVGGSSSIRYIVAQLHYLNPKPNGDESGVTLTLQREAVPYSAGMLSFASWFTIPPRKKEHLVVNNCCYRGFQPLTTFAVRVHTHGMGRAVFMARPKANGTGITVLADGDPLKPQGFNPVARRSTIYPGDPLTVTCVFDSSDKDAPVTAGPTHDHEMCNMYLMVYSAIPHIEMCNDGEGMVAETQPGSLPRGALVAPDPFPGWKPPQPADKVPSGGAEGVLGDVTSVALGPDGTLWALHRGGAVWDENTFDPGTGKMRNPKPIPVAVVVQMEADTGKVLRRWGAGVFYMPHMLRVDNDGNVWVADVGRHQVLKFSPVGNPLLEVGTKLEPGAGKDKLCKPTQATFLRDGSFIVADGYCNSRAVRFTADGKYHSDGGAAAGPMSVVHSVVADECGRRLYLADREGRRVVVLDLDSYDLQESVDLERFGRVWALTQGPYGQVLALAWEKGRNASLVEVAGYDDSAPLAWPLPGSAELWPHDAVLGAAALALSGAGDRLFAAYAAPLCAGCGPVRKYVLFPTAYARTAPLPSVSSKTGKPVLAHLGADHVGHGGPLIGQPGGGGGGGEAQDEAAASSTEAKPESRKEGEVSAGGGDKAAAGQEEQLREGMATVVKQLSSKGGEKDEWEEDDGPQAQDVHETLHSRGAPGRALWLSVAQVAVAAAVLAAFVGAIAVKMVARQHAGGLGGGEMVRLNGGSRSAAPADGGWRGGGERGGSGLFDGAELELRNGHGAPRGRARPGGIGGAAAAGDAESPHGADADLERLEREMLLRGGARS